MLPTENPIDLFFFCVDSLDGYRPLGTRESWA